MELNTIYNMDCIEWMKLIPDGSIDAIITDPPYWTTACKWDTVIPFDLMWEQLKRIIKPNGAIVLFGSEPFSSFLRTSNIDMYRYDWIWEKEQWTNQFLAKVQPMKKHEIMSVFYLDEAEVKWRSILFQEIRDYFNNEKGRLNLTNSIIKNILWNWMWWHYFTKWTQWTLPTEENYKKLQSTWWFNIEYEVLRNKYEILSERCRLPYNPQFEQVERKTSIRDKNWWKDKITWIKLKETFYDNKWLKYPTTILKFNRELQWRFHPTQKPVWLIEYLIKTYTNEWETVLDFTMGSWTTAIACINTNRNYIWFELDENYWNIANKRIQDSLSE